MHKVKLSIIILYFLLSVSSIAEMEKITTVCDEVSFLKCTNKNKQECINSFNLSVSYCDKKHPYKFDDNHNYSNLEKAIGVFMKCTMSSVLAYYDDDGVKLEKCLSITKYGKKLEKMMNEKLKK